MSLNARTEDPEESELVDCGWATVTATDLWRRAQLWGVPASALLP